MSPGSAALSPPQTTSRLAQLADFLFSPTPIFLSFFPQCGSLSQAIIIHKVQHKDSLSRQFCNPVLDRDNMIKSPAYNREFNLHRLAKQKDQIMYFQMRKVGC